ncbi:MAG TPA: serine hydrolase domain-containing protein [Armatimonadaceae bacterium]|nr:serine hydrolase domain-containing protein [Armatimonadaceae bacterium]
MGDSLPGVPATREMHMRVGGVTLTCLCVAMLRLADRGVLSLEDRLSRWHPELPRSGDVTLRMLANCTSGYPDYILSARFQNDFYGNPFRAFSPEELLAYALETSPLYAPGTDWNYAHTNFVILGGVLQKVTGQSVAALLRREIIDPLRLRDTDYSLTPEIRSPVLHAFSLERGVFEDSTYWNPSWTSYSGLLTSNLYDLGVLARAVGTGSLLSAKARGEQVAPTTVGLGRNLPDLYYGLGVILMNTWMVQNPRFGGYNLIFAHLPSRRLSVVVSATRGPTSDPDTAYSTQIFKDLVNVLAPDTPIPEGV